MAADPRFPPTRLSAVGSLASEDASVRARAFETLVQAYWKPVYAHVRFKWRRDPEDARDVVQAFFARVFEKGQLASYDPARARFRTYLKTSLDHFVSNEARRDGRQKRGGATIHLSLDFDAAEDALQRSGADPEDSFDREWSRYLLESAVAAFETSCTSQGKERYFEVFRRYVLDPELSGGAPQPSYAQVAHALDMSVTDVTNYLSWSRREFRARVLETLREITATDDEFREEARALIGSDP